jgi:hypothetical protein
MTLRPGNYYVISALVHQEVMFLREGEETNLLSRTLRDARCFKKEDDALRTLHEARKCFSKFIVREMKVMSLDIFGKGKNMMVGIAERETV